MISLNSDFPQKSPESYGFSVRSNFSEVLFLARSNFIDLGMDHILASPPKTLKYGLAKIYSAKIRPTLKFGPLQYVGKIFLNDHKKKVMKKGNKIHHVEGSFQSPLHSIEYFFFMYIFINQEKGTRQKQIDHNSSLKGPWESK